MDHTAVSAIKASSVTLKDLAKKPEENTVNWQILIRNAGNVFKNSSHTKQAHCTFSEMVRVQRIARILI